MSWIHLHVGTWWSLLLLIEYYFIIWLSLSLSPSLSLSLSLSLYLKTIPILSHDESRLMAGSESWSAFPCICQPCTVTVFKQALLLYQGTPCRIQFDQSPVTDSMEVRLVFSTNSSTPPCTHLYHVWMIEYIHLYIHTHTYVCHGLIQSAVIRVWGPADFGVISLITFIWHNLQVMIIHL